MVYSPWKWQSLPLLVSLLALVLSILPLFLVHVEKYSNMSASQADAQEERYLSAQIAACQHAGGDPQADGTTMYCNVAFQPPDTSWYVTPISNPNYEVWGILQPLLVVLAGVLAVIAGRLTYVLFFCRGMGKRSARACSGR
jgi:hypothetical protein